MTDVPSTNTIAAIAASVSAVIVGWFTFRASTKSSREDVAARTLASQLTGWGSLNEATQGLLDEFRSQRDEDRKRIDELEKQNRECLDDNAKFKRAISELQIRVGDRVLPLQEGAASFTALVVLVEDDDGLARTCVRALSHSRFDTAFFSSGQPALNYIAEHKPDVMIVDLALPDMDGEQVAEAARARGYAGPIIAMSGSIIPDNAVFSAQLLKPFRTQELIDAVRAAVAPRH